MTLDAKINTQPTSARAARVAFLRESVGRLQAEGRNEDEIATILGISRFSVRAFDRELNPPVARPRVEKTPRPTAGDDWPLADIAKLRELWTDGFSTAEIARRMSRSKNSVVGKAHRLKLDARASPIRPKGSGVPASAPRVGRNTLPTLASAVAAAESRAVVPTPPPTAAPIEFVDARLGGAAELARAREKAAEAIAPIEIPKAAAPVPVPPAAPERDGCRFPMWQHTDRPPIPPLFCGTPRKGTASYCAAHCLVCFTPYTNRMLQQANTTP